MRDADQRAQGVGLPLLWHPCGGVISGVMRPPPAMYRSERRPGAVTDRRRAAGAEQQPVRWLGRQRAVCPEVNAAVGGWSRTGGLLWA